VDTRGSRTAFEVFVAIIATVAIIGGFYAFGRAVGDEDESDAVEAVDAENAAAVSDADVQVAGATESVPEGQAAHADHGEDAAAHEEVDDRGFAALENGEQHHADFTQPLTAAERTELARQLELAREVAMQYPTVADAEAAGYKRAGPFAPGLGAHYINFGAAAASFGQDDGVWNDDDIRSPTAYIYDGVKPDSKVAGLFYGGGSGDTPPEGFAGANDIWHKHSNVCIVYGADGIDTPLGADRDVTQAQCQKVNGSLIEQTNYLLHVWVVPGYESPEGVFSHLSSAVTCADGTYHTIDTSDIGVVSSVCLDAQ